MALWMWIALGILIAINITAFVLFGIDKERALRERRRLPEAYLLWLALLGGAAGAIAGQQIFRHKTRKQPFRTLLIGAAVVNLVVAALVLSPEVRAYLAGLVG
ncbi:MAG TPA: DUF1294 domain-containing protein [Terricaulis sp.]|jgi:Predicted membrane protein|nr:DUF1294 domain-containing protein [Terricaulis sp.]